MKDWLFEKIGAMFGPKYIGATVRTLVAALSGVLLSVGLQPELVAKFSEVLDPVLSGLLTLAVTWLWSVIQKKRHSD